MSLDTTNIVSTVALIGVMAIPAVVVPMVAGPGLAVAWGPLPAHLFQVAMAGLPFAMSLVAFVWAPSGLEIAHDELRILRRCGNSRSIPLASIVSVEEGPEPTVRLMGVSGLLGSYGLFSAPAFGNFNLYATRRENFVALRLKEGLPAVVTPDEPDHFRQLLERRLVATHQPPFRGGG